MQRLVGLLILFSGVLPCRLTANEDVTSPSAVTIARQIDDAIEAAWSAADVSPTEVAGDGEFHRRLRLDVTGRIPTVAEARDYLDDPRPAAEKRIELVRDVFADPTHLVHQTNFWRTILIPEAGSDITARQYVPEFEDWLRRRLLAGVRYDDLVREVLSVPRVQLMDAGGGTPASLPGAFFDLRRDQPELLATATSRAFLGVRLDCAQCHDHPFDDWKQDQFWQLAAFFAPAEEYDADGCPLPAIAIPETDRTVAAAFLDGSEPARDFDPRRPLAEWITARENPYFARATANRLWAQFFGAGLVEPVDDFSKYNQPSHSALLKTLAEAVRTTDYDLDRVAEAITLTRAYGLSSRAAVNDGADPDDLTRMPVRALNPEQLYDSLSQATGRLRAFDSSQPVNFNADADRTAFLERFARESVAARDQPSSILQALMMMNSAFIGDATDLESSRTLRAVLDAPFLTEQDRIETLYLAAYARRPTQAERDAASAFLAGSTATDEAFADLFWVLLNSGEFLFNH